MDSFMTGKRLFFPKLFFLDIDLSLLKTKENKIKHNSEKTLYAYKNYGKNFTL